MKIIIAVIALSLSACTTYNGYPALIPLCCESTYAVANSGVTITPVTVQSGGRSSSFTVITPARGK